MVTSKKSSFCCDLEAPKKGKSSILPVALISLAIIFVGIIGGAYYYLGQPDFVSDVPPTLDRVGSKFKGQSIGENLGTLVFDQTDVDSYEVPENAVFDSSDEGIEYYYSEQDLTIDEIIQNIKPEQGLQILIAYYVPQDDCYYICPKGPYPATCEIRNTKDFKIPAGRGYSIISSKEFEYNSNIIKNAKSEPESEYLNEYKSVEGWILLPIKSESTLSTDLSDNIWILTADNSFQKADSDNPSLKNNYHMAWFKITAP
jgi:hypothetical protein